MQADCSLAVSIRFTRRTAGLSDFFSIPNRRSFSLSMASIIDKSLSLVCTEDTVKDVKKVRAELNKEFQELEAQRKEIKSAIMDKYNEFETIYKARVANLYNKADSSLKEKIANVEYQLKKEKEEEIREFFEEHCKDKNVNVQFERMGLNITLSASMKSLKEQTLAFIEKIASDLKLIELEEYKEEILLEYNKTLDFANSKLVVVQKHKQIEEMQKRQEELARKKAEEEKVIEAVEEVIEEEITAPELVEDGVEEEQQMMVVAFQVTATVEQIRELKQWLKERNIQYA